VPLQEEERDPDRQEVKEVFSSFPEVEVIILQLVVVVVTVVRLLSKV